MRLDIRKTETLKKDGSEYGNRVKVRVLKNKVAPPFKTAEFDLIYGEGASKIGCILDVAVDLKIIDKSGSWYSFGDEKLGQGREKSVETLAANPKMLADIDAQVREKLRSWRNPTNAASESDAEAAE